MPLLRLFLLVMALAVWLQPAQAVDAGAAVDLVPHRASYLVTLGDGDSSSPVVQAQGRFDFEWGDACDGWTVVQRFQVYLIYEDGLAVNFGWSLSSWESKDGNRYRFFIRRFEGDREVEKVRGRAQLESDGSGAAVYSQPAEKEVALPRGTLFPTGHTIDVLARSDDTSTPLWRMVFDGSGEEGLFGVSAALSQRLPAGTATQIDSPLVSEVHSWQLSLAFYGVDESNAEPDQEQRVRLFANGVVDEMRLHYGDFVLDADLTSIEPLPEPDC